MNRRVVVSEHGGPHVLVGIEEDLPEPGPGEVRVAVEAAGVSAFDLMYRRWSRLPGSPPVPFTLGEDVVGRVDKLGPGVKSFEVGQRVAAGAWTSGVGGGYTESICLPEGAFVSVPAGIDPAEAVCVVVNYLTAHLHLHEYGEVKRGERALVHGAAGGVGSAAVELGRVAGLEMYGTASPRNLELVSKLGATAIDYRSEDFVERIRQDTGDGVDVVVDPVGGARQLLRSYRTLRRGGRLVWLGAAATKKHGLSIGITSLLMVSLLRLVPDGRGVPKTPELDTFSLAHPEWYRSSLTMLLDRLKAGELRPIVAERVPLLEAARAHERLERGGHAGKIVLVTDIYSHVP